MTEQIQRAWERVQQYVARIPPPGPRSVGCAKCCAIFASTGVIFLCVIGNLIKTQPLYVLGIDSPPRAANNVFAAAWIYVAIVAISIGILTYDKMNEQQRSPLRGRHRGGHPEYGSITYKSDF
mmetsp:Transcript_9732/g.13522  ORF Transcript_9732/g.13522 Transcript_9732/m.13522 type:complete len:123 (+) Transcript_9732:88-456(+)